MVDRNVNFCKIHWIYKYWYNNTEIHKNKKEQCKSKKSFNEIRLMLTKHIKALFVSFL